MNISKGRLHCRAIKVATTVSAVACYCANYVVAKSQATNSTIPSISDVQHSFITVEGNTPRDIELCTRADAIVKSLCRSCNNFRRFVEYTHTHHNVICIVCYVQRVARQVYN